MTPTREINGVPPAGDSTAHIIESLRPLAVPIDDLKLDAANANTHPGKNLVAIEHSLDQFGQRKPIVVRKTDMVVEAGNGTLIAARRLGWTHLAAVLVDDDPTTALRYALADNRSAELAEWDTDLLSQVLATLDGKGVDIEGLGWTTEEMAAFAKSVQYPDTEQQLFGLSYSVVVRDLDETSQAALLTRLEAEGFKCELLMS